MYFWHYFWVKCSTWIILKGKPLSAGVVSLDDLLQMPQKHAINQSINQSINPSNHPSIKPNCHVDSMGSCPKPHVSQSITRSFKLYQHHDLVLNVLSDVKRPKIGTLHKFHFTSENFHEFSKENCWISFLKWQTQTYQNPRHQHRKNVHCKVTWKGGVEKNWCHNIIGAKKST